MTRHSDLHTPGISGQAAIEERHRARIVVCHKARDVKDAKLLLDILGLLHDSAEVEEDQ